MTEIYTMPGHLIRRLQQISISVFSDRMRRLGHDLTAPQFATLSVLARAPGIDQATLAGLIAHDRPTIGGVVERLEAKGLVTRHQSEKDRRAKVLALSDDGTALLEALLPHVREIQPDILPGLSSDERTEFIRLATKVAHAGNATARAPYAARAPHDAASSVAGKSQSGSTEPS
ncbi:MarR family winged helix-turn-helix transcriptional regulator [Jannaschia sp. CCS1]|uniref:MarR family winged helix-turn-helix transcriptional regulator n=1 Tax=Jannaschia sp. (strain CCS1) TaxID=290400 RepID=UPI00140FEFDB|nr:MarR family transcriptional regulator [Jannaschia sp. CCS1]